MDILALLRAERDKVARQLEGLNAAVAAFAGSYGGKNITSLNGRGRGRLSAAARARIAAAQRARWAKLKDQKSATSAAAGKRKGKRTMSAAAKAKIAAGQRARWAKIKKGRETAK